MSSLSCSTIWRPHSTVVRLPPSILVLIALFGVPCLKALDVTVSVTNPANFGPSSSPQTLAVVYSVTSTPNPTAGQVYAELHNSLDATVSTSSAVTVGAALSLSVPANTAGKNFYVKVVYSGGGASIQDANHNTTYYSWSAGAGRCQPGFSIQSIPTISWNPPAQLTYPSALAFSALNASASVPGTFTCLASPTSGSSTPIVSGSSVTLAAESYGLALSFAPTDSTTYASPASLTRSLKVNKGAASISVTSSSAVYNGSPRSIGYNTSPSGVAVAVSYTDPQHLDSNNNPSPVSAPTDVGVYVYSAAIADNNYQGPAVSGGFSITPGLFTLSWNKPGPINYGTHLSGVQLNATAWLGGSQAQGGSFSYWLDSNYTISADNAVLNASDQEQSLYVKYVPSNPNYDIAKASTTIKVDRLPVGISWPTPNPITYGTRLTAGASGQLNAAADTAGTFTYWLDAACTTTSANNALLNAGANQLLYAKFVPSDTNHETSIAHVSLTVQKATPTIQWSTPADVVYGTKLSTTQLNAVAHDPTTDATLSGSLSYSPALDTVLTSVGNQTLTATFTPSAADAVNYAACSKSVTLVVNKAPVAVTLTTTSRNYTGSPVAPTWTLSPAVAVGVNYLDLWRADGNGPPVLTSAPTEAGDYKVVMTVVAPDNQNYRIGSYSPSNQIFQIIPASPNCTVKDAQWTGKHTVTQSDLDAMFVWGGAGAKSYAIVDGGSVTPIQAGVTVLDIGKYTIRSTLTGAFHANYGSGTAEAHAEVLPSTLTGGIVTVGVNEGATLLFGEGWAADPDTGAGVAAVDIQLDDAPLTTANVGLSSPSGVTQTNAGWSFYFPLSNGIAAGSHTIKAYASRASGANRTLIDTRSFSVNQPGSSTGTSNPPASSSGIISWAGFPAEWVNRDGEKWVLLAAGATASYTPRVVIAPLIDGVSYTIQVSRDGNPPDGVTVTAVGGYYYTAPVQTLAANSRTRFRASVTQSGAGVPYDGGSVEVVVKTYSEDHNNPTPPPNLRSSEVTTHSFKLNWAEAGDDQKIDYYVVTDATDAANPKAAGPRIYAHDPNLASATYSLQYDSLTDNKRYKMEVRAYDWAGNVSPPSTIEVTTMSVDTAAPTVPGQPFVTDVGPTSAVLHWGPSYDDANGSGIAGYRIQLYVAGSATAVTYTAGATEVSKLLSPLTVGASYRLTIQSIDSAGNLSDWASVAFDTIQPSKPFGLAASNVTDHGFRLAWADFTVGTRTDHYVARIAGEEKELGASDIAGFHIPISATGFENLTADTAYSAEVKAVGRNADGTVAESDWSDPLPVRTDIAKVALPADIARPNAPDSVVAGVGGGLSVDNHGGANYSIPLPIAGGRGGLQPTLSLSYNSGAGNGVLGVGFSLSTGFPQAITRGRSIKARDNEVRGVEFSSTDKFYLDGKRLICSNAATFAYGQPGSAYRTEVDSFLSIATSGANGNIETFVATDKAGTKFTFGQYAGSTDAYQRGGGETQGLAYVYALKRVEDCLGNYVSFTYQPLGGGEYVLSRIDYTGGVGISPLARVSFTYTSRDDEPVTYLAGRIFDHRARLALITAAMAGKSVGAGTPGESDYATTALYHLEYDRDTTLGRGRSRLHKVYPFLRDPHADPAKMVSLHELTLEWQNQQNVLETKATELKPLDIVWGDTNLDGKDDIIQASEREDPPNSNEPTNYCVKTGDFDGNGKKDTLKITIGPSGVGVGSVEGASVSFSGTGIAQFTSYFKDPGNGSTQKYLLLKMEGFSAGSRITVADFNGDGRDDVLVHGFDGRIHVFFSDGTQFLNAKDDDASHSPFLFGEGNVSWALEWVNGAGMWGFNSWVDDHAFVHPVPCDLNGDGLTDYVCLSHSRYINYANGFNISSPTGMVMFRHCYGVLSRPDGSFSAPFQIGGPALSVPIQTDEPAANPSGTVGRIKLNDVNAGMLAGDFNGDGLTDFLVLVPEFGSQSPTLFANFYGGRRWALYLNEGTRAGSVPQFSQHNGPIDNTYAISGKTVKPYYSPVSTGNTGYILDPVKFFMSVSSAGYGAEGISFYKALEGGGGTTNTFAIDVNHDGLTDLVWYVAQDQNEEDAGAAKGWYALLSTGRFDASGKHFGAPVKLDFLSGVDGSTPFPLSQTTAGSSLHFDSVVISHDFDANGDGHPDWLVQPAGNGRPNKSKLYHATNGGTSDDRSPAFSDVLVKISDGLGRETSISYRAAKDDSVYTASAAAVSYPIREVRASNPVVSEVFHDTGSKLAADRAHFTYQYSGNILDLSGRGSLGFHCFLTQDVQTKLFKYQFLAQSFPMTGLAQREETYRSLGDNKYHLISSHDNTIVFDKVGGSSGPTLWPFISQAVEYRWEDGASKIVGAANVEQLFSSDRHLDQAHIKIVAQSTFDGQSAPMLNFPDSTTNTGLDARGYHPSDITTSGAASSPITTHNVAGSTSYGIFDSLPGAITRGNLTKLVTDYGDGLTETVTTEYDPTTALGIAGRVHSVTTTVTSPHPTTPAPTKTYEYDGDTALVTKETLTATNSDFNLTTVYNRTDSGETRHRVKKVTVTGKNLLAQDGQSPSIDTSTIVSYDDRFDTPTEVKDAYGNATKTAYHWFLGQPTSVTDANHVRVAHRYDALGRATETTQAIISGQDETTFDTVWTTYTADSSQSVTPPSGDSPITVQSAYSVTVSATAKPTVTTYYDRLGRPLIVKKTGYKDAVATAETAYNKLGQTIATSLPHHTSDTVQWTTSAYDELGRVKKVVAPNGTETTTAYKGRTTTVTVDAKPIDGGVDPDAQATTTLVDAKGRTVAVWNANNSPGTLSATTGGSTTPSIAFDLDGFGRMVATHLKGGVDISASYDPYGRQTALNDPDKGDWKYENSPLGYVLKQTDARLTTTQTSYDKLGRPINRVTQEPSSGPKETVDWYYYDAAADAATHHVTYTDKGWIGALQREELAILNGLGYAATPANAATSTVHYYDTKGRLSIDLSSIDQKWFYTYRDYDESLNLLKNIRYYWRPADLEDDPKKSPYLWQDFGYTYGYTTNGYLTSIADTAGRTWWQAGDTDGYDALDRITHFQKGGYSTTRTYRPSDGVLTGISTTTSGSTTVQNLSFGYDGLGNLRKRTDGSLVEEATYDSLNRLESTQVAGQSVASYTYEDNGNLSTKAGVSGTYGYDLLHPHAVASAGGYTMGYDPNGNLASRENAALGEAWRFSYPGFDKPRWMARTAPGTGTKGSEFLYNAGRSRILQLEFESFGTAPGDYVRKRVYAYGASLELNYAKKPAETVWGLDKIRVYVSGPDGVALGAREWSPTKTSGPREDVYLYHADHLGSIHVVTPFAGAGAPAADLKNKPGRFSETAWGQRRDPLTWVGAPTTTDDGGADSLTPRGFTGHEMLDDLGLVHMNGRIYDPLLGRMLSADVVVQFPGSLQSYNRYSYVQNNPLTLIDPTGFNSAAAFYYSTTQNQIRLELQKKYGGNEANRILTQANFAEARGTLAGTMIVTAAASWIERAAAALHLTGEAEQAVNANAPQTGSDGGRVAPQPPTDDPEQERYQKYWEQDYSNSDGQNTRQRDQVPPGTDSITDQKKSSSSDEVYERETVYDEYGRRVGNTDYTDHGRPDVHDNPHHHSNPPIGPGNQGQHGPAEPGVHPLSPNAEPQDAPTEPTPPPPPPEDPLKKKT